jgi:FecR protein
MNGGDWTAVSDRLRVLIDDYCADEVDEAGLLELEAGLLASECARRYFAEYWLVHADLGFSSRARRAASLALSRFRDGPPSAPAAGAPRGPRPHRRESFRPSLRVLALAGSVLAAAGFTAGQWGWWKARVGADAPPRNVAWLINAQDCVWAADDADTPGRDMKVGKVLRLERGLAEVEFDRGARVILNGPSALEMVSDNEVRLLSGSITVKVPVAAHGFTVHSPQGKVVDLGTEFGVSVDGPATTSVRVFSGALTAASGDGRDPVSLVENQEAVLDGRAVSLRQPGAEKAGKFVRSIDPPPVILPRTLRLDFSRNVAGTLLDVEGRGIGMTRRLPGTGHALAPRDPNLRLDPEARALELTTTRSDLNKQIGLDVGEYFGLRLSDLGFTGREDFIVSVEMPDIPGLERVGQFGLYTGSSGSRAIRGGVLRQKDGGYSLFLVNNVNGIDRDVHEVGLTNTGDHLRFTLQRDKGRYSLLAENLTRQSSSRLAIAHPAFLDPERDLYVGIFGANTQSDVRKTLKIKKFSVTVYTEAPARSQDTSPNAGVGPEGTPRTRTGPQAPTGSITGDRQARVRPPIGTRPSPGTPRPAGDAGLLPFAQLSTRRPRE